MKTSIKTNKGKKYITGVHFTKALPPEQWVGARVLLMLVNRMVGKGTTIDLPELKKLWEMEVVKFEQ